MTELLTGDESMDVSALFADLLDVWQHGDPGRIERLITEDYVGHMLHLADGERDASTYATWITGFRAEHPGCRFEVQDQAQVGDRVFTRLVAINPDGSQAHGMNTSRIASDRIAEEWAIWTGFRGT